jgi:hypothetical protein
VADRLTELEEGLLYREMKCSVGGVMLLVRLHGDLVVQPAGFVEGIAALAESVDPAELFPEGSRLAETCSWIEKKFGRANAIRAVIETAGEVLSAQAPLN